MWSVSVSAQWVGRDKVWLAGVATRVFARVCDLKWHQAAKFVREDDLGPKLHHTSVRTEGGGMPPPEDAGGGMLGWTNLP